MSYERIKRTEDARIRAIDKERNPEGTNGIGKAFTLRATPDWRAMHAMLYDAKGKRIAGGAR